MLANDRRFWLLRWRYLPLFVNNVVNISNLGRVSAEMKLLDSYDRKIMQRLSDEGRATWSDLAEHIGLSLTPTVRRVRALEEQGYITGYSARLDEKKLAGAISVFVSDARQASAHCIGGV